MERSHTCVGYYPYNCAVLRRGNGRPVPTRDPLAPVPLLWLLTWKMSTDPIRGVEDERRLRRAPRSVWVLPRPPVGDDGIGRRCEV